MRSLIHQLRPADLETGLLHALSKYGQRLGLVNTAKAAGLRELPRKVEEAFLRIGQEALNNVSIPIRERRLSSSLWACRAPNCAFPIPDAA
jgi:signal transduction histidine kinase